jgi:hypothetical protein
VPWGGRLNLPSIPADYSGRQRGASLRNPGLGRRAFINPSVLVLPYFAAQLAPQLLGGVCESHGQA